MRRMQTTRGVLMKQGLAIMLLTLLCSGFWVLSPDEVHAWPTKFSSCSGCHSLADADATIATAFNAVAGTSVSVAPGATFELDFVIRNVSGNGVMGIELALPAGWTIASGTANAPALTGWNNVWNVAAGAFWATPSSYSTAVEFPLSPLGYTINFDGTGWDSGNRNAAYDNASGATPGDRDGVANTMGGDVRITVPGGTANGSYTVRINGVGHQGGTKAHFSQVLTVTVAAGGDVTAPVPGTVTVTPQFGTIVPAGFTISTPFTDAESVVSSCQYTLNGGGGWNAGVVSGASPNFACTANVTGQTNGASLTINMRATSTGGTGTATAIARTVDAIVPNVTSTVPTNGATGVALNGIVTINFSENVNCSTINTTNITSTSPTWTLNNCVGSQALFNTGGQANGTLYNVNVTAAVTDAAGNAMSAAYPFSYTTAAVANNPPNAPSALAQLKLDGVTSIAVGGYTTEASVIFNSNLTDPDLDTVKLQIDTNSDGTFDCESALVAQQANYKLTCPLVDGSYNWQARTVDNIGATSSWVVFNAANPDFTKDASVPVDGILTPSPADGQIVLNWTAATDAHSGLTSPAYKLVMASGTTTPPVDCSGAAIYSGNALTWTQTPLTNGLDYAFRLCATNNAGLVSIGTTATAQPAAGCAYSNPTVTILTASKDITADGGFVDYTLQVSNNDSAICANANYALSVSDSNSTNFYASVLAQTSLTNVAPGATAQTTFRVSAKANQPNSVTNNSDVTTAADSNHAAVTSTAITTTINVSAGGCEAAGDYLLSNGDRLSTSR